VRRALERLGVEGTVAAVTAGWQEREPEERELGEHLSRPVVNLALYLRAERLFARDKELFEALRRRQERLRALQRLYQLRLAYALDAARELLRLDGDPRLIDAERESAIDAVRSLDAHHLARLKELHAEFDDRWRPLERDAVERTRKTLADKLERCGALLIAGGHVAVLLNRLRLFGVLDLFQDKPVIAWSAGAMSLAERIVLFHDSPPQGPGNAEVFDVGLGLAPGIVPLPHASQRLRLEDPIRVGLFARRFAPARSIPLQEGTEIRWHGDEWRAGDELAELRADGSVAAEASR
jgi:hypothetical protein